MTMTYTIRLDIYEALEERSYLTVQDLALRLDSGTPATQTQVRAVLYAEPEAFYQMEDWWDLAIFHRFEGQTFHGKGKGGFDERKFLDRVLAEALRAKGRPIQLKTLAEKYLLKIRNRLGLQKNQFPTGTGEILRRLRRYLEDNPDFHLLHDDCVECVWTAPEWQEVAEPAPVVAPVYRLPDDFLDRAALHLEKRGPQPVRLLDILTALLGIDANHADFSAAFAQANDTLSREKMTFAQVQEQAWMLANYLPAAIEDIPARVAIPRWRNSQEEKLVDELYELPLDVLAEAASFAGDDAREAEPAQFDENYFGPLRLVLPYHWRQNGVLKVNANERRLFPERPARAHLQFTDQTAETFPVWLNNDTGYLHGLKEWYAAYLVPAGGVFYIQRTAGSHYKFKIWMVESASRTFDGKQYFCEVDPDTYIEEDRLRDLEALRAKVEAAAATIKDVMCDLFESCPPDASLHYKQVWAQVHVIRPTTRRTVAAILSAFPCFYQADPGSGFWRYIPGLRNAPPKYQARRVAKPAPAVKPTPVEARPARYWLAPVSAASWDKLARPAGAGEGVFLAPWHGRSRVGRTDGVAFFDTGTERVIAAVEALQQPILDAATGRRELTVKPALDAFNPIPYADLAGALSVPKPDPEGFPVEITPEDWKLLLERLRPTAAPKPVEPTLEDLIGIVLPKPEKPDEGEIILRTFGPNPTIAAFIAKHGRPYDPREPYTRSAFASPVKAGKNTALYMVHSYHTKVPPQGIEPYIEHYTRPGEVILDPFCGSGMTGVAALKLGRSIILNDLSPAAVHIAYNYCAPVDMNDLRREFARIRESVKDEFAWLYETVCDRCKGPATIQYTIWSDVFACADCGKSLVLWDVAVDHSTGKVHESFACPYCGKEHSKLGLKRLPECPVRTVYVCPQCRPGRWEHSTTQSERELIAEIDSAGIPYWTPDAEFDVNGPQYRRNALASRRIKKVTDLYTKRNLRALACLWAQSKTCESPRLTAAVQFALTAVSTRLVSRLTGYQFGKRGNVPVSGTIYVPSLSVERNVLDALDGKIEDIERSWGTLSAGNAICQVGSATSMPTVPSSSVDYIFTDPPFGSSIYYSEVNLLWEAWLQEFTDASNEAVVHRQQDGGTKRLPDYARLMEECFGEMYRVLKPGRWVSVVFHNSDDRVWQAIQGAAETIGFDLVNAMVFDKEQRSFKGIRGEKGLEKVTNFDIVLNLHKRGEAQPTAQTEAQERIEALIVAAVRKHLLNGPAPDYRTGQYLHSLAIRTLLNEKISVEITWAQLEAILGREFRHVNCHWYLPREAVAPSGHGFLVRSDAAAVAWLEHILAANPQTEADLIPQWQIATLGTGSKIKATLGELLCDNFWPDETTGAWTVPTSTQREILRKRRAKPQQLPLELEFEGSEQPSLFDAQPELPTADLPPNEPDTMAPEGSKDTGDATSNSTPDSAQPAAETSTASSTAFAGDGSDVAVLPEYLTPGARQQVEWSDDSQPAYVVVRQNQQSVLQPQFYNRACLTRWTFGGQRVDLKSQHRYLCILGGASKLGWVRVGQKTVSLPQNALNIGTYEHFYNSPRWEVRFIAEWDEIKAKEANLRVEFNRPSEPKALTLTALFLPDFVQIVSITRIATDDLQRAAATKELLGRILNDRSAFDLRLRHLMMEEFEYVDALVGESGDAFFGRPHSAYSLRLVRQSDTCMLVAHQIDDK